MQSDCKHIIELDERLSDIEHRLEQVEASQLPTYTQKAAAAYLGMSRHTLRRHTEMGLINCVPGTTRYLAKDLQRYKIKRQKK